MTAGRKRAIVLKDATLREGLDTPGVSFDSRARNRILQALVSAGVPEVEVVAPSRVAEDLVWARTARRAGVRLSGLVYAAGPQATRELELAQGVLDHVDVLMPLSPRRRPFAASAKERCLSRVLADAPHGGLDVGAGFPHAFSVKSDVLREIAETAVKAGATRITVYDTNGAADPFAVCARVAQLVADLRVPVFFHGHDDLGLATANAWAAIQAGASGLDVTVNGLGDRAGNTSLEQLAVLLHVRGLATGIRLPLIRALSRLVARSSGVPVAPLAPVVGALVYTHRSPSHLTAPAEFEAFDPALLGAHRAARVSGRRRSAS